MARQVEYFLKRPITHADIEFGRGTMIHPVFNKGYLSRELRQELEYLNKYALSIGGALQVKKIMCMVGKFWIAIDEDNIEHRY